MLSTFDVYSSWQRGCVKLIFGPDPVWNGNWELYRHNCVVILHSKPASNNTLCSNNCVILLEVACT